jgi:hypothetical protein
MTTITDQIGAYSVTTSKAQIAREATDAAIAGISINDACPYPFGSQRAAYFKMWYRLCRPLAADVAQGTAGKGGAA